MRWIQWDLKGAFKDPVGPLADTRAARTGVSSLTPRQQACHPHHLMRGRGEGGKKREGRREGGRARGIQVLVRLLKACCNGSSATAIILPALCLARKSSPSASS